MKGLNDFGFNDEQKEYIKHIVEKRRKRSHKAFFDRYGVKSLDELDNVVMDSLSIKKLFNDSGDEYFLLLVNTIAETKRFKAGLTKREFVRLSDELALIQKGKTAEVIYKLYKVAKICDRMGEPYLLPIHQASLFILYLLGVAKMNPLNYGACYETYLGTFYSLKPIAAIHLYVREGFVDTLLDLVLELDNSYKPYYDIDMDGNVMKNSIHFMKRDKDVSSLVEEKDGCKFEVFKEPHTCIYEGITVRVFDYDKLQLVKDALEVNPNLDYRKGLTNVKKSLMMNNGKALGIGQIKNCKLSNSIESATIEDLVKLYSLSCACTSDSDDDISPFYDRDSVFSYFWILGIETAFELSEKVRKGALKKGSPYEEMMDKDTFEKLTKCKHLTSRASSAEQVYMHLLLAADL